MNDRNLVDDWEAYDAVYEPFDARTRSLRRKARAIVKELKSSQRIPLDQAAFTRDFGTQLLQDIFSNRILRPVDSEELIADVEQAVLVAGYLHDHAHAFKVPEPAEVQLIVGEYEPAGDFHQRLGMYRAEANLALLSKPAGEQYWRLLRSLMNRIESELGRCSVPDRLTLMQIRGVLKWLAPAGYYDQGSKTYYPSSKYGYRTKNIEWIVSAGLPSLGRKS